MPRAGAELDPARAPDGAPPPCYVSSRSADVILSDVRPTQLAPDALVAINNLLDELLHTVLSAARALDTPQLRAGLHRVLPTTLGKEAVLEAELELRAYWERSGGTPGSGSSQVAVEDGSFNLKWAFQLLRLKCEAYSTLSDTDENSDAETRLFQRMSAEGIPLPKQTLLAPASLYLTAIIESICEHIVSNVGRVAARDSSRAIANGQDLFIALCEDSSIYGLFKNMSVYGQIEALSKVPRSRRSVSVAHENDGTPSAHSSSFRHHGSVYQSRTRLSSESVNNVLVSTTNSSRPSLDKSRSVKMLYNKVSQDFINGSDPGHRKMDSLASANTKQSLASKSDRSPVSPTFSEDTRSQEFDDMMRSGSTMKVSLTPDRLRTMEVLNKEKARQNGRQKALTNTEKSDGADVSMSHSSPDQAKRANGSISTVRRVASIIGSEDDRSTQKPPPTSRPRQLSAATASSYTTPSFTRVWASSTTDPSTTPPSATLNKHTLSADQRASFGPVPRRMIPSTELDLNTSRPPLSRESLDLNDMAGSDDDDGMGELKSIVSPKRDRQRGLSTSTRDLIAFLAEGPPEVTPSEKPPSPLPGTPKKSSRLQKMMSRISLASETVKSPRKMAVGSGDASSKSMTNLSPLANRPVPPRYPTSGSPSVASSERSSADQAGTYPRQRAQSHIQKSIHTWDGKPVEGDGSSASTGMEETRRIAPVPIIFQRLTENDISQHVQPTKPPSSTTLLSPPTGSTTVSVRVEIADATPASLVQPPPSPSPPILTRHTSSQTPSAQLQRVEPPRVSETHLPAPSVLEHVREMRAMLEHATSAAECRILVDMFLARSKLSDVTKSQPLAPPPPRESEASELEEAIVELFLGDGELDAQQKPSPGFHCTEPVETPPEAADAACSVPSASRPTEPGEPC